MSKKKIVSLILAAAMALCLFAGASTAFADDTVTVSIQFGYPEESAAGQLEVLKQMEEASGGKLKFDIYFSYSFVEAADVVDALETNMVNISCFMPTENSQFTLNGHLAALPLLNYPDWQAAIKIYDHMVYNNEAMMKEFTDNGMVFWTGYVCPGYQFYSTKEITDFTPAAFNGLTIMCDNAEMTQLINANKGGAITAFVTDYLSNLQNGVCEGLVQHLNCAFVFGTLDYIKSAIFFGEGGFYNLPLVFGMSDLFWNDLPDDLKQIFMEYADDFTIAQYQTDLGLYENAAYPTLQANAEITVLDDEQIAVWQDACTDIVANAVETMTQDNPATPEVYEQLKDLIANYDAETFEIGNTNFGLPFEW